MRLSTTSRRSTTTSSYPKSSTNNKSKVPNQLPLELIDKLKNGLVGQNKSGFEDVDEEDDFDFEYDDDFED